MTEKRERYEQLYNKNKDDIFRFIRRTIYDVDLAMDLLQDVFFNFFRIFNSRELPDDIQCRMYSFRIARNLMINHFKRAYNRKVDVVGEVYDSQMLNSRLGRSNEKTFVEEIELADSDRLLNELLLELKENERTSLILRYNLDMNLGEIAAILNISLSSTSRLVKRSAEKIRKKGEERGIFL